MEKIKEELKRINKLGFKRIVGVCLIICLIILGILIFKMIKENSKCVENPFVYGAQETAEQGLEIICSCIPLDPKYVGFNFDKDGLIIQKNFIDINFNP